MKLIGLTGGVGMGKSAAEELLRKRGLPVIDTDQLARQLVEPGQPALREIVDAFGAEVLSPDGRLQRRKLAARVFADADARRRLERILHPRIRRSWLAQADVWRLEQRPVAVVVIPLLFETGAEKEMNATICVACTARTQQVRLAGRGWSPDHIRQRIAAQWPIQEKIARADYVLWNEGTLEVLEAQLERVLNRF
ncbi:MAG TPA: dephospho-CoA kinase [Verrucomicrobia bacterium]|nr:dephospho-CoA kinase [Verrucomicrobiota bacterium]HOB32199.1 dephospho-CoA kinase [Verrucomicrobiota bacterium]HOP96001.1 dephospho-CoA kinase [Verrucomicrobiota bacterium]